MKIEVFEMIKFFLHKIRRIERHLRFILKTNDEEVLYTKINVDISEAEMADKTQKSSERFDKFKHYTNVGKNWKFPQKKDHQKNQWKPKTQKKPSRTNSKEKDPPEKRVLEKTITEPILTKNEPTMKLESETKMTPKLKEKIKNQTEMKIPHEPKQSPKEPTKIEETKRQQEIADQLRMEGTEQLNEKKFPQAIQLYDQALNYSPNDARIKANICLCHWNMKKYFECFENAMEILNDDEAKFKTPKLIQGMFRKVVHAALKMKDYDIALTMAERAINYTSIEETRDLCNKVLHERKNCENNFPSIKATGSQSGRM